MRQTCSNQQLSLPGHKKGDHKFEILLFFPWLWLNLRGLCSPFLTISFNLCTFLHGVMHLREQQCVSYSHYKGNDVRGECLVDRRGREKSPACLSRYQVSLNEGFQVSLIISSHLSRCPRVLGGISHPSWGVEPATVSWWIVHLDFVNFPPFMFSLAV